MNNKTSIQTTESIESYLKNHENKKLLKFITCGSVDDGKSTLIGRLLYDSKVVFDDQIAQVKNETKKYGTTGEEIDFALLVDGLQSEREQGITIDVAYRFFYSNRKKYIIADTPGHEQYTRNMVTGASTSELAIILIDARKGVLTQTRRHSFIVSLLGLSHIVVTINKMDLVDYNQEVYEKIKLDYLKMYEKLKLSLPYKNFSQTIEFIPVSALKGDNIIKKSKNMAWYNGVSLMEYLDNIETNDEQCFFKTSCFRFPVQYVNRVNFDFRGYCGVVASGEIFQGDKVVVYPSMQKTKIKEIIKPAYLMDLSKAKIKSADSSKAVTLIFEDEIDVSSGDLIVKEEDLEPRFTNAFEVMLVWMSERPVKQGDRFDIKLYSKELTCSIDKIFFKKDVNSWEKLKTNSLELNDIARCSVSLEGEVAYDMYEENKTTGSFILIDRITNNTVGAGMIVGAATSKPMQIRKYTEAEIALNRYIREHFPEWECKEIK
jgi:sulfate adenylyltransferase subunit 1